jgi:hypothetical protein
MENISGITLSLGLIGFVLLVVALVAIFYKPAKRLKVDCNFKQGSDNSLKSSLLIDIENIGKRSMKLMPPFVKFTQTTHSKLFAVKPEYVRCKFPLWLKVGEKLNCEVDLNHFTIPLEKIEFIPTHLKIIVNDSAGLDFESRSLEIKP